jgi:glutaredoxin-like protein
MLKDRSGQRVPDAVFQTRENNEWKALSTQDVFSGKTLIVFSLPGAFTPTCSSTHLPRYEQLAGVFRDNGVDEIVCISVNDAFVMDEWKRAQKADQVRVLPDGNGEFTEKMGMLVDKSPIGFGKRSWRYSMLVKDGLIDKMFIEPEKPGDPFDVSDADTMLRYINPKANVPASIALFTRPGCAHCARAKKALDARGWSYEEIVLGRDANTRAMEAVSGGPTTPQVFIGGTRIGTADDLDAYLATH